MAVGFSDVSFTQTSPGNKTATVKFRISGAETGSTWEIQVNGYTKTPSTGNQNVQNGVLITTMISLDNYATYTGRIVVKKGMNSWYSANFTFEINQAGAGQEGGFSLSGATNSGFYVTITPRSGYNYYHIFIRESSQSTTTLDPWIQTSGLNNAGYSASGLKPGTQYVVNVGYATSSGGSVSGYFGQKTITTTGSAPVPSLAVFSATEQTGKRVYCQWSIQNDMDTTRVELRYSTTAPSNYQTNGTLVGTYYSGTTSGTITISQAGTYYIWACLYNGNTYIGAKSRTVTIREERPDTWSWTGTESGAFASHGSIKSLTMGRWNAFIERVNEAVTCCNGNLGSSISQVSSSMGTNRIMYATNFNEVRRIVDQLCTAAGVTGTGIGNVATGGVIYGLYFTSLSGALNRAINNM